MFSNFLTIILSTHYIFVSNTINSQAQKSISPLNLILSQSQISSHKIKNRDYLSGIKPDLKSRKVLIYLCFYTLTFLPLIAILPSPHVLRGQDSYQIHCPKPCLYQGSFGGTYPSLTIVCGNISTAFLGLSVDRNISSLSLERIPYFKKAEQHLTYAILPIIKHLQLQVIYCFQPLNIL